MPRKTLSFATFLLVVSLLLLSIASQATTGWVYSYGSVVQNGVCGQSYVNVYDYGTARASGFYFNSSSGSFKSVTIDTVTYTNTNGVCTDAVLTGQGSFTTGAQASAVTTKGTYTLHIWKGTVGGVYATWGQAQLLSTDAVPVLLWATGSAWPAAASTPIRMAGAILRPYTP